MPSSAQPSLEQRVVIELMTPPGPLEPPMAMQISAAEQAHHALLRQRSYELAVARGHVRR